MKKIIISALIFLQTLAFGAISADQIQSVMNLKIDKAISVIKQNRGKAGLEKQINDIFDEVFDYEKMAKYSLGKTQYNKLNDAQKKEFTKQFEKRLKTSFFENLKSYNDEKIEVIGLKDVKTRKVLQTKLVKPDKVYTIDYKFYNSKTKGWLIYDVEILNISVIRSYQNQFARVLIDGDFNKLLELLKKAKFSE